MLAHLLHTRVAQRQHGHAHAQQRQLASSAARRLRRVLQQCAGRHCHRKFGGDIRTLRPIVQRHKLRQRLASGEERQASLFSNRQVERGNISPRASMCTGQLQIAQVQQQLHTLSPSLTYTTTW